MALNKLKKWIGTQAMTAFFDQLNDNVDATNAAIDLAEQNAVNLSLINFSSSLTPISGVGSLLAYKVGRVYLLSFTYQPTTTGFTIGVITGIPSAYLPGVIIAGSVAATGAYVDGDRGIAAAMNTSGSVSITATTLPSYAMQFTFTWIA